ncbi:MOSC domain containing protein [Rubrobacter xylanophilus DSM 9941]|uniref:MOSC domain containing protein n=1 Tax=Rubrobacter xylanophilus (strain DSM 9941 / JCM 11954 / NBRC 16129 / PRD-1) TaxID=266117 RepID=Q1AU76_RUBXD|nr:MOSC domain-containing protein [Rubrobacter xylanophilus]ABG05052.1 MOSC domain containing protein [Rubrobacter xylanophilus DSM 9941]
MGAVVVEISVGRVGRLAGRGKGVKSAIFKRPLGGPAWLGREGFAGDEQADRKNHGGPEKAAFVYPTEHYPRWQEMLGLELPPAAFGENLSTRGLAEDGVCLGDVYRLGGALVQVSQPRRPCYKPAWRFGVRDLALLTQESGMTGFYLRVLEEGEVAPGDALALLERPVGAVSVGEANRVMHRDRDDAEGMGRLLAAPGLPPSWHAAFERRLAGVGEDGAGRLEGPVGA